MHDQSGLYILPRWVVSATSCRSNLDSVHQVLLLGGLEKYGFKALIHNFQTTLSKLVHNLLDRHMSKYLCFVGCSEPGSRLRERHLCGGSGARCVQGVSGGGADALRLLPETTPQVTAQGLDMGRVRRQCGVWIQVHTGLCGYERKRKEPPKTLGRIGKDINEFT